MEMNTGRTIDDLMELESITEIKLPEQVSSYTTDLVVKGISVDAEGVQVTGWDSAKKGYNQLMLPQGMPTPKVGDKLLVSVSLEGK